MGTLVTVVIVLAYMIGFAGLLVLTNQKCPKCRCRLNMCSACDR